MQTVRAPRSMDLLMPADEALDGLIIRKAEAADLRGLAQLSRRTFTHKFGHLYSQEDLDAFLDASHTEAAYAQWLEQPDVLLDVAMDAAGTLCAYLLCGPLSLPAAAPQPGAVELKRLYVDRPVQRRGLGRILIDRALDWARGRNAGEIYLSVFSENHDARRLYESYGWTLEGEFIFHVGAHEDLEFLMRRPLP